MSHLLTNETRPYDREVAVFFGQVEPRALVLRERVFDAAECAACWSWVGLDDGDVHGGRMHVLQARFRLVL